MNGALFQQFNLQAGMACSFFALAAASAAGAQSSSVISTSSVISASSAGAASSSAPGAEATAVGEIIVTAQRRSESVNHVPISITALSGAQLANRNIKDLADLTRSVPGFTEAKSAGGTPIYTIRGVGFNTDSMSATSPVGIYVDEVAYAYPYMSTDVLFDLERVEVLKGPQGTLYGRNTTGGLVNFVAAKPKDYFEAGGSLEYANYASYEATGYISGALAPTLRARFAFKINGRADDWQTSITREDHLGKAAQQAARAILVWEPTPKLTSTLTGSFWRDDSDTQAAQETAYMPMVPAFGNPAGYKSILTTPNATLADWTPLNYPGPFSNGYTRPPFQVHANFFALSERVDYHIDANHELISLTGFNEVDRHQMTDKGGTSLETAGRYADGGIHSYSQELRLTGNDGRAKWLVGGYFGIDQTHDQLVGFDNDMSIIGELRYIATLVPSPYTPQQLAEGFRDYQAIIDIHDRTAAAFANVDYDVTSQLKLTGGIRYTNEDQNFHGCSADYQGNLVPIWNTALALITGTNAHLQPNECLTYTNNFSGSAGLVGIDLPEHNLSLRGVLSWTPTSSALFYASVSRGYKAGAFPFSSANVESQLEPAKQEEVLAFEGGAKLGLLNRRLEANFAGYYYDYRNKQLSARVFDPVFGTLQRLENIPTAKVYGAEIDLTGRIAEGLTAHVSGNYLHTAVGPFIAYTLAGTLADFTGQSFPLSPSLMADASLDYQHPVSSSMGAGLSVSADYQSKSKGQLEPNPLLEIDARTLMDASVFAYGLDDKWRIEVWAKNLLNTYYWNNTDSEQDTFIRFAGMPRTFGIKMSRKF